MGRSDAWALRAVPFDAHGLPDRSGADTFSADKSREEISASDLVLALYDTERVPLARYVFFLGMDPENSRDLVQDAFLKLHQHVLEGGDRSQLRAWLYRVAHNLAMNRHRGPQARLTQPLEISAEGNDQVSAELSPEDALLHQERDALLDQAMKRLTAARRHCLLLRSQGFRYREIATILDTSTSTVAEHVQKGIEQIKRELEKGATGK